MKSKLWKEKKLKIQTKDAGKGLLENATLKSMYCFCIVSNLGLDISSSVKINHIYDLFDKYFIPYICPVSSQ